MAIPDFQTIMLPLLKYASSGKQHTIRDTIDTLAKEFHLSQEEKEEHLPSGTQSVFYNRVIWARIYLTRAGLLIAPARGIFMITDAGRKVLESNPQRIDMRYLQQFPAYVDWRKTFKADDSQAEESPNTPAEELEKGFHKLREALAAELLDKVKVSNPRFFEKLVVELLVKMGYGGSLQDAGQVVGRIGDGGVDGLIKEDKLGLDIVYVQAKRWDNVVGRPIVQAFAGSLEGFRARKGVMITTSKFTEDARDYTTRIEKRIVLIDGHELARLMIDYDVGVTTVSTYAVKRMDSDYFEEE